MQCSCGGQTNKRSEITRPYRLAYVECWACGRCGSWRLTENGYRIASGVEAQRKFNELEQQNGY